MMPYRTPQAEARLKAALVIVSLALTFAPDWDRVQQSIEDACEGNDALMITCASVLMACSQEGGA